jgi:hypothetical protein
MESFVLDGRLSGAARMARTWLCLFPGSQFIRRAAAWYVSLWSGYRVFPFRQGRAFDAAVEEWEPSGALMERLKRQCREVRREGASRRSSLLMVYAVLRPHDPKKLEEVLKRVREAVGPDRRGDAWFTWLPLPPEEELGEFDA